MHSQHNNGLIILADIADHFCYCCEISASHIESDIPITNLIPSISLNDTISLFEFDSECVIFVTHIVTDIHHYVLYLSLISFTSTIVDNVLYDTLISCFSIIFDNSL